MFLPENRKTIMKLQVYPIFILTLLVLLCIAAFLSSLAWGNKILDFADVWKFVSSPKMTISPEQHHIALVINHRFVRTLAVLLCGSALGLSGALMQGLTRNPLADSGLLGINTGAAAMIASAAFFPFLQTNIFWLALLGSLLVAILISILGLSKEDGSSNFIILVGMAISVCLYAYVQAVTQLNPQVFDQYRFWVSGSFGGIKVSQIISVLPFFTVGVVLALCCSRYVNMIAFDKQTAMSLGTNILLIQSVVLLAAALLSAASVALAGPIVFIGLGSVHISRKLIGSDYRFLIPAAMLNGATLLCFADVLARTVVRPSEIATGIMTALLGAPLLYVLVIFKRAQS